VYILCYKYYDNFSYKVYTVPLSAMKVPAVYLGTKKKIYTYPQHTDGDYITP